MRITKQKETPATKQTTFWKQISSLNTKQETLFPSHARNFFYNHAKNPFISIIVLYFHLFKT
ncbi:hypothetical protein F8158_27810 [Bacillus cereus]|uniref:Uncharacterized protein n=1 Tax=Bacillus cereus TaxID=1396 RepID=A0AB34CZM3_BACCE|nr:hypothetical protein F8158_27810 [Bacillus cereus]